MLKIVFIIIIALHGLIHLMGFMKAFDLAKLSQLTGNISKPVGLAWFAAFALFLFSSGLFISKNEWWWLFAFISVVLSQILIITSWQDAKFGTIPNTIILLVVIINFAIWQFQLQVKKETKEILMENSSIKQIVTEEMIRDLPLPVKKWLKNSGIISREIIQTVYLEQKGLMRLKPEQKEWIKSEAKQYFTTQNPSFIWSVKTSMKGLPVVGRDLFKDGQGKMEIKLLGILPVVNVSGNSKTNQSTLQRYLGEIIWFPTAALSSYIKWEPIDEKSAKATMTYNGTVGSGIYYFNEKGEPTKFVAKRYKDISDEKPAEWMAEILEYRTVDGIKIPSKIEASWILKEDKFTWYKFEILNVRYNIK